nr:hypothetical protein [Tanacetum cinerariifolium]
MALTFADTHNMIVFLTKSDASEGFEQIIDFLNTSVIQYALMVNPTIYVSCIKQFWSSVSLKKTNDVVRLQALIDRRKVIITEDTVRQALRLDDADSIDCLPNEEIHAELARMGFKVKTVRKLGVISLIGLAQSEKLLEQTDGEAMINSIQNGYQPLPVIVQVPLAGNAPNAPPTLKDPKFWTAEEKKTQKIDRLARSLLIQGLSNDIIQNQGDVNDALGYKTKAVKVTSDPLALVTEKTKEGHFAKDCKKANVKDYNYFKTKMLLAKKESDEQVLLTEDQAWMESSSDSD